MPVSFISPDGEVLNGLLKDRDMKNFLAIYTNMHGKTVRQFVVASENVTAPIVAGQVRATVFGVSKILVRPCFDPELIAMGVNRRCEAAAILVAQYDGPLGAVVLVDPEETDHIIAKLANTLWAIV